MAGFALSPGIPGQMYCSMDEALGGNGIGKAEPIRFHSFTPSLIQQLSLMSSVCKMALKKQSSELAVHQNPWEEEGDKNISGPQFCSRLKVNQPTNQPIK